MILNCRFTIIGLCLFGVLNAQNKKNTLFTIDNQPYTTSNFVKVYNKNLDLVTDENQKSIDGYLKLYIDYQLKLKEAKRLELHKNTKYTNELKKYTNQLTQKYINDNKATKALVKEAYERLSYDVKAAHALVKLNEFSKDTAQAYNKALELREKIINNGFNATKAQAHNGKTVFVEDLGYFSAFKMVYDFENAVYKTPVGEVSMPFRTRFGYHVVKVDEKAPTKGTITLAHIMVAHKQNDSTINPENRINQIYKKLTQGEAFENLAKQFSDDKSTAAKGGQFAPFRRGQLNAEAFENVAFNLENDGDYSKPIKTQYGWHIVKRIKLEPIKSYEIIEPELELRVSRDARSKLIDKAMVKKLENKYTITKNPEAKTYFESVLNANYYSNTWEKPSAFKTNEMLFSIQNKKFTYNDFFNHLNAKQRFYNNKEVPLSAIIDKEYKAFFNTSILQFRKDNLVNENEEYATILKEYTDGLLLFDLMEDQVWDKATNDTLALQNYYKNHQDKYQWNKRIDVLMASSEKKEDIEKTKALMYKNNDKKALSAVVNANENQNVIFTETVFDINSLRIPKNLELKKGVSKIYEHNNNYHVFLIKNILPVGTKTFEEAKGNVISDYQQQLENDLLKKLHKTYTVVINNRVLKRLKKKLNN